MNKESLNIILSQYEFKISNVTLEDLIKVRKELGITKESICKKIDVSRQTVYNFENGISENLILWRYYHKLYCGYIKEKMIEEMYKENTNE